MSNCPATFLYDLTKAGVFGYRNVDKTLSGDIVRGAVAAGQLNNAAIALSNSDGVFGNSAKIFTNGLNTAAKCNTVLGYTAKAVDWTSKHINPLICISGAVRVAQADDKKSEAIKQTSAISCMFGLEKTAKLFLTDEGQKKLISSNLSKNKYVSKLLNFSQNLDKTAKAAGASKIAKFGIPIAKACAFIACSITGYKIGAALGDHINDELKAGKKRPVQYMA